MLNALKNLTAPQASLADSFLGAITSGIGAIGQVKRAKKVAQFQNDLAVQNLKLQNEMNQDNWIAQQEYNTPSRQLQRLQEAGLNPNLMYQSAPSNVATSPQDSGDFYAPNVDSPDVAGAFNEVGKQIGGIMSNYMQNKAVEQNIQESKGREMQAQAQTNLLQDQLLTNAQNRRIELQREIRESGKYPFQLEYLKRDLIKTDQEIENLRQTFAHNIEYLRLRQNQDERESTELRSILKLNESSIIRNTVLSDLDRYIVNYRNEFGHEPPRTAMEKVTYDSLKHVVGDDATAKTLLATGSSLWSITKELVKIAAHAKLKGLARRK